MGHLHLALLLINNYSCMIWKLFYQFVVAEGAISPLRSNYAPKDKNRILV
jgi:hypothetical protein